MKRYLLIILLTTSFASFSQSNPVVLELFTSQGCSSCPPADDLLQQIDKQYKDQNVHILTYHVDYWDYIGWKDPFATKAFTEKQYNYARLFKSRNVYTPQLVIQGREHFTGSDRTTLLKKLAYYQTKKPSVAIALLETEVENQKVQISYSVPAFKRANTITFALKIDQKTTAVKRGENRGKSLENTNIVIAEKTVLLTAENGTSTLEIPKWVSTDEILTLMIYVSADEGILGSLSRKLSRK